jgi:phage shock protein A
MVQAIARQIIEPIKDQIDLIRQDAREARDGMMKLTTAVEAQNVTKRIDGLAEDMRVQHAALRQDVVLGINNVKGDVKAVEGRVHTLEQDKERREGGLLLVRLIKEYGAWFMGLGAAFLAMYGKITFRGH